MLKNIHYQYSQLLCCWLDQAEYIVNWNNWVQRCIYGAQSLNPIPCGGGGSDLTPPPLQFSSCGKKKLSVWSNWNFLTIPKKLSYTFYIFKKFSRGPLSPTFWVPQRIPCGGGGSDLTPLPKSSVFIVERPNLHFFHTKLNFQQLLFSSYFGKIKFWTILGPKSWTLVEGVGSDPPPPHVHPL